LVPIERLLATLNTAVCVFPDWCFYASQNRIRKNRCLWILSSSLYISLFPPASLFLPRTCHPSVFSHPICPLKPVKTIPVGSCNPCDNNILVTIVDYPGAIFPCISIPNKNPGSVPYFHNSNLPLWLVVVYMCTSILFEMCLSFRVVLCLCWKELQTKTKYK
jgi:hypothetical protein